MSLAPAAGILPVPKLRKEVVAIYLSKTTGRPPRRCAPRGDVGFVLASPRCRNFTGAEIAERGRGYLPFKDHRQTATSLRSSR